MSGQASVAPGSLKTLSFAEILDLAPVIRGSDLAARLAHPVSKGTIAPPSELASLLSGQLPLGGIGIISGALGHGGSSLCYRILAAGNEAGGYVALLDPGGHAMPAALIESGIMADRFVLVRIRDLAAPREILLRGLGALLDGFSLVGILDPHLLKDIPWRRVAARARERRVLVVVVGNPIGDISPLFHLDLSEPCWERDPGGILLRRSVWVAVSSSGHPRGERIHIGDGAGESLGKYSERLA